jgi:Ca2+-binding EF-hand superfamily protein
MFIRWICAVLLLLGTTNAVWAVPLSSTDKIVNVFMELDADNNDGVSYEEYTTMVQERARTRFMAMDANRDEELSAEEYRKFWLRQKAQWYRLKR